MSLLMPKNQKYRKEFKGRGAFSGVASRCDSISFGSFGIKSLGNARITARQMESVRKVIARYIKQGGRKRGKMWARIFPNVPVSSKPAEVRMGSGKGAVDFWVARVKPGTILFEVDGISKEVAQNCFRLAADKLPVPTKFVSI